MKNTQPTNNEFDVIPWSALAIDKVHNCEDCPIRKMAMKQPRSFFARIHAWHATWWPGWKARQARQCAYRAAAKVQA